MSEIDELKKMVSAQGVLIEQLSRLSAETFSLLANRTGRPYWNLTDGWALAHLDSGEPFYVNTRDTTVTPWILMGGIGRPMLRKSSFLMHSRE